jgi:hypothetical protein
MDVDEITHERLPKMNPDLKEQLMKEGNFFFCRKAKTCPKTVVLGSKPEFDLT